jgi:hypothetical protein
MPGHAGNFVSRLFSLGPETMPLIRQSVMTEYIDHGLEISDTFDRLANYQFSTVSTEFDTWQEFHRAYADHKEYLFYRLLNVFCNRKYARIVFPLHPYEFDHDFSGDEDSEFFYVDLDLDIWGGWVESEQQKLQFQVRSMEKEQFDQIKHQYSMKPISLTRLLESDHAFVQEYQRVCTEMQISPLLEQALILRKDWYLTRVNQL